MFLPEGLELEEDDSNLVDCKIHQEEDDGPIFTVKVRILPVREYRKIFAKLQGRDTGGFRSNNAAQDKVDRDYLEKVVKGWSGLTVANWNSLVRDGKKIGGEKAAAFEKKKEEIPFSQEACFYLYRNTWPQDFGNKVFDLLQDGAAEEEEYEEDLKKS